MQQAATAIVLLINLWTVFALAQETGAWTPRSPLKYATSFHSYVLNEEASAFRGQFNSACLAAIRGILNSGGDFYSSVMERPEYMRMLSDYPVSLETPGSLYHYSKSSEFVRLASAGRFDEIFGYLRSKADRGSENLYVAGDSSSSRGFGSHLVRIDFAKNARVFFPHGLVGKRNDLAGSGEVAVLLELVAKYPSLSKCDLNTGAIIVENGIVILAAEANRVDFLAYAGLNNIIWGIGVGSQWLQLLNSWSILKVEYLVK